MSNGVKKSELTTFAKTCADGAFNMLNGVCISEEVVKSKIGKELRNEDNEELLIEISKRYAKYTNDQMGFDVRNGEVQEFQYIIKRIVACCEENNWFE